MIVNIAVNGTIYSIPVAANTTEEMVKEFVNCEEYSYVNSRFSENSGEFKCYAYLSSARKYNGCIVRTDVKIPRIKGGKRVDTMFSVRSEKNEVPYVQYYSWQSDFNVEALKAAIEAGCFEFEVFEVNSDIKAVSADFDCKKYAEEMSAALNAAVASVDSKYRIKTC